MKEVFKVVVNQSKNEKLSVDLDVPLLKFTYNGSRIRDSYPDIKFDNYNLSLTYLWLNIKYDIMFNNIHDYQRVKNLCWVYFSPILF